MQRKTRQRDAIRQAFLDSKRPLSPNEVQEKAARHAPGVGIATVYRALKEFVDQGWLQTVEIPGRPACYELKNLPHHHHFHCRQCGRVFDMAECPGQLDRLAPTGFRVESHELTLVGLCPDCVATETTGGRKA